MKIKYEEWLNEKKRKEEIKLSVVKAERAAKKLEEEKKYALSSSMIASTPFSFVKVTISKSVLEGRSTMVSFFLTLHGGFSRDKPHFPEAHQCSVLC